MASIEERLWQEELKPYTKKIKRQEMVNSAIAIIGTGLSLALIGGGVLWVIKELIA